MTTVTTTTDMKWYVLRVASNKEDAVRDALERKVKIEGLESKVGRILVPTIKEKRMKSGSAKVIERKQYPGYVFVEMQVGPDGKVMEDVFFVFNETAGVGDFVSSGNKPTPMQSHEVEKMLGDISAGEEEATIATDYKKGDQVKIKDGPFQNFEGMVDSIDDQNGKVNVIVTIFGRSTPLELQYWQIEKA